MARTATDSKSLTARQRARQAMADELERARTLETQLASVFTAIDAAEDAKAALGDALTKLRDLGVPRGELAAKTGLSARNVSSALRASKTKASTSDSTDDTNTDGPDDTKAASSVEAGDGSDTH